jgi:hypothetical protein
MTPSCRSRRTEQHKLWYARIAITGSGLFWFLLSLLGMQAPAAGQSLEWTQLMPPPQSAAMAFDSARGVTVLFTGSTGATNGETWESNGTVWTQRAVSGPSPRGGHAMAYDAARGVTVLFGGYNWPNSYGDTWEWNGTAWTQRAVSGPSPRTSCAVYDAGPRRGSALWGRDDWRRRQRGDLGMGRHSLDSKGSERARAPMGTRDGLRHRPRCDHAVRWLRSQCPQWRNLGMGRHSLDAASSDRALAEAVTCHGL